MCLVFFCEKRYSLTTKTLRQVLISSFVIFCEIMIGLVLAHHFLWINCEISDFLWILDISSKFIIIHDRMYPLGLLYDRSEEWFDEIDPHCCYFLWNHWIICEIVELFVNNCYFLWIFEISGKTIIIYNGMILWILFRDLETILDESGARCPYFLWNRWIICEKLLFFVNFSIKK